MTWTCDYDFKLIMENVNTEDKKTEAPTLNELLEANGNEPLASNSEQEGPEFEPTPFEEPDILISNLAQLTALKDEVDGKLLILRVESERLHKLVDFYSSSLSKLREEET